MRKSVLFISILFFAFAIQAGKAIPLHQLYFKDRALGVECARTPQERARGLMYRDALPLDQGMLFVFEKEQRVSFWMKNTRIPLSIAFIDRYGKILEIRSMKPFDETHIISRSDQVLYALETNLGYFSDHKITPGDFIQNLPE
ncbi:MAG: DUF192 domain-containing protein [Verrucomicrobiota bacterium]